MWYVILTGLLTLVLGWLAPLVAKRVGARGEISQDRRVDFNAILAAQDGVIDKMQTRLDAERNRCIGLEKELWDVKERNSVLEGVLIKAGWREINGEWRLV
jgi:hypothetical protein